MTQRELNRAVANLTGETVDRVQRIGFNLTVAPRPMAYWRHGRALQARRARANIAKQSEPQELAAAAR
jgi:hypothetical protein